jgi:alkylated DNA repair dioxygenase AlkB
MHPTIQGLYIIDDIIDDIEEEKLKRGANEGDWDSVGYNSEKSRRIQHFGYKYNYRSRSVGKDDYLGKLPEWSTSIEDKIMEIPVVKQLQKNRPNQLIVNEYKPGQGISWHTDANTFDDPVITLSTGGSCIFEMRHPDINDNTPIELFLKPKTLVVMTGDSRWKWQHRIPTRGVDRYDGEDHIRHTRISFTYRWTLNK